MCNSTTTSTWRNKRGLHMKKRSKGKLKLPTSVERSEAAKTTTLKKLRKLQRITNPGYKEMNLGTLFQKTANHIFVLEAKLNVLKSLSALFGA
ncbi:hypothetical protein TorRG33x02_135770 [Trema orientale]|uniref:Myc-type, basic helix-loop-helix (BHLH) domain containing protein n=1 Tax=Trema orientale TaxID=63057 RepID=A0A2P5EYW3_TREOI|nr:hypothetical protein TorRG33x02_135770 [Trema orientale]